MKLKIIFFLAMSVYLTYANAMQEDLKEKAITNEQKNIRQPFSLFDHAFYRLIRSKKVTQSNIETLDIPNDLKPRFSSFYSEIDNAQGSYKQELGIVLEKYRKNEELPENLWDLFAGAAYGGDAYLVRFLLFLGVNINARTRFDDTVLMCAVGSGQAEVVKLLIAFGADVNAKAQSIKSEVVTALSLAQAGEYSEIVDLLKEAGAEE